MARVLPAVGVSNIAASLQMMNTYLTTHGKVKPTQNDWELYVLAQNARKRPRHDDVHDSEGRER